MKKHAMARAMVAGLVMAASVFSAPANAENYIYGLLFSGAPSAPSGSFAQLSITQPAFNVFNFSLYTTSMNGMFPAGASIHGVAVNTSPNVGAPLVTISNVSGRGVDGVSVIGGHGPNGVYDFGFQTGSESGGHEGAHGLGSNQFVSWTATFNSTTPVTFSASGGSPAFALHVHGAGTHGGSAWYAPSATSAAPEPEIYAMMLAGTLMVGFVARRRRVRPA